MERGPLQRARFLWGAIPAAVVFASPAPAAEGELEQAPPASSAAEIQTSIQRMFPDAPERRPPPFPWFRQRLQKLPPFFADTQLAARFRTYYLREDQTSDVLSEAWAMGGSIYYHSGWLEDLFAVEVEGFTSQPIVAPDSKGGTLLLQPVQDGYSALGIANGKLRYKGIELAGYRQYLDLPYLNRQDNRMTPNTFEAITLRKPEGELQFIAGYAWNIKSRNSDDFDSFGKALGLDKDRGNAYGGVIWDSNENFHIGAYGGAVPDVAARTYVELGVGRDLAHGWQGRIDGQFMYLWDIGDDLLGDGVDDTWNLAIRAVASRGGAVFRLGLGIAGPDAPDRNDFGSTPSYTDLIQRTFNAPDEKALLASISYDFSGLGVDGLSAIVNFAAGFDGKVDGGRSDAQEVDVTIDYRMKKEGWMKSFWLRVRGWWLHQESAVQDGTGARVILRYDFPVI
jgi:hypothetical protein